MAGFFVKIIVFTLIVIGGYHAAQYFLAERLALQTKTCAQPGDLAMIRGDLNSDVEKHEVAARVYHCIKDQQTWLDQLYFDIPDAWLVMPAH